MKLYLKYIISTGIFLLILLYTLFSLNKSEYCQYEVYQGGYVIDSPTLKCKGSYTSGDNYFKQIHNMNDVIEITTLYQPEKYKEIKCNGKLEYKLRDQK